MNSKKKLRIGILAHEFLINIGANDFLKNIIRGLAVKEENEFIFLCPRSHERIEQIASGELKEQLKKIPYLKKIFRSINSFMGPVSDKLIKRSNDEYAFYAEACPKMEFVICEMTASSLIKLQEERKIDIFLPSIHELPLSLPYVTYWPDCQPKHYPEFFNDEAQKARDTRILALLESKKPMIINSNHAKTDMLRFYQANPEQIFSLPFAPIIEFDKLVPRPELRLSYKLPQHYFIVCNQFWIHKSLETVIEAAALMKRNGRKVNIVFTGKMQEPRRPEYIFNLRQMVIDLDVADSIQFLNYIPKDDQIELMKNSIAVIQPTLFEGGPGGGSIYDAMSLGLRAIVSDIPINKELPLNSQALIFFEKKNPADLADKMVHCLNTSYANPSVETLFQQSKQSSEKLSKSLYQAIDYALSL